MDQLTIAGDINATIEKHPVTGVVGKYGEYHLNENGAMLRDFSTINKLKITNTFLRRNI
jgi:hypothetical protein